MRQRITFFVLGCMLLMITGLASAQLPPPTPTPPDLRLVETFISRDGTWAFNYPAGWIAQDSGDLLVLASSEHALFAEFFRDLLPGELYLSISFRLREDYAENSTPTDWLIDFYRIEPFRDAAGNPVITLPRNLIIRSDEIVLTDNRPAAVGDRVFDPAVTGGPASATLTAVFEAGDHIAILVAGAQHRQLQPFEPLIHQIAASLQSVQQDRSTTRYFISTFEEGDTTSALWPQGSVIGGQAAILAGFYNLINTTPGGVTLAFPQQDEVYESFNLFMVGMLDTAASSPTSSFGVAFRYVDDDNYARFAIDGGGHYSLARRVNGTWEELVAWTQNDVLRPLGGLNSIEIYDDGSFVSIYVNGNYMVDADMYDDSFAGGKVGLYLASGDTGTAGVLVDYLSLMP